MSRWLALGVYALAPLPFGSVDGPWVLLWIVLLAISLLLADISQISPATARVLLMVYGIAAALIIIVALQLLPLGLAPDPPWSQASLQLHVPLAQRISASASRPLFALGPPLLFLLALLRAILLGTEAETYRDVPRIIGFAALGYAAYGLLVLASGSNTVLWLEKTAHRDNLTATFLNRNTAATYFGTALLIWALQLQSLMRSHFREAETVSELLRGAVASPWHLRLTALATLICFGALAATGSRAGLILSGLALALSLLLHRRRQARWQQPKRLVWIVAGVGALVLIEIFGGRVANRIDLQGLTDAGRFDVYLATLQMIATHPLGGIGLGNFEWVFPSVRPVGIGSAGIWNRAHNTPLELVAEMGLPFLGIILAFTIFVGLRLLRASLQTRERIIVIGLCTGILGLLHSLLDYSLQISGYSVVFAAVVGVGLARACAPGARSVNAR